MLPQFKYIHASDAKKAYEIYMAANKPEYGSLFELVMTRYAIGQVNNSIGEKQLIPLTEEEFLSYTKIIHN